MAAVPSIGRANRVEGAAAPEADLTRALYEQYAAQILRYCMHQLGSREEAEDAVQSTFLNAFRGIQRGIVPELESAWLFSIAHNVCLSRRRSTWRRGRIEAPTDFDVVEELAPAPSRRSDELIGLQDVLEGMPEQQRRAILLREWQGLSYREIAAEMELSQSAVETLIFRARRSLAQGLEEPPAEPKRRRRVHAGIFGNLLSSAQSFLIGGGAAVKVAATVAVVSAGTVVATAPVHQNAPTRPHTSAPAPARAVDHVVAPARTPASGGTSGAAKPADPAGGVQRVVPQSPSHHMVHGSTATVAPLVPPAADAAPAAAEAVAPEPVRPAVVPAEPARPQDARGPATQPETTQETKPESKPEKKSETKQETKSDPPAAATPLVTPPADTPSPKVKNDDAHDAPGQAKKNDDAPATAPATGKADAAGQVKKNEPVAPPAEPVVAVAPEPAAASPTPAADTTAKDHGNGNDKPSAPDPGKAKGKDK